LGLIENTATCLEFFRDLRSEECQTKRGKIKFVTLSLGKVTRIDYGTISILTAIGDDLKYKEIISKRHFARQSRMQRFYVRIGLFK